MSSLNYSHCKLERNNKFYILAYILLTGSISYTWFELYFFFGIYCQMYFTTINMHLLKGISTLHYIM